MPTWSPLALLGPWPPPYGGVAVHLERLHSLVGQHGVDASVLTFSDEGHGSVARRLRFGSRRRPTHLASLARAVRPGGVIHNHYSSLTMYDSAAEDDGTVRDIESLFGFARALRVRRVETVHDQTIIDRWRTASEPTKALFRRSVLGSTVVIAGHPDLVDFLVEIGVAPSNLVEIGPLLPRAGPLPALQEPERSFLATHAPVWVAVGAFTPLYDYTTTAIAFRATLEQNPRAGLVLLSGGFAADAAYASEVESSLAGSPNVLRLADIANSRALSLMAEADLVIRGARTESFGLSRAEALSVGTPVVATATGETRFTIPYRHRDVASLIEAVNCAIGQDVSGAATYFDTLAARNAERLLGVYRGLGILPRESWPA